MYMRPDKVTQCHSVVQYRLDDKEQQSDINT